jgi:hypothetical protein
MHAELKQCHNYFNKLYGDTIVINTSARITKQITVKLNARKQLQRQPPNQRSPLYLSEVNNCKINWHGEKFGSY